MSLLTSFRIVIVLFVFGSHWQESVTNHVEERKAEVILKKRYIESSSTDVDDWIRDSPEASGRSNDDLDGASSIRDTGSSARNLNNHDRQKATLDFEQDQIPSTRKALIRVKLAAHHEKITEMRIEWRRLGKLLVFIEKHEDSLRQWGQVASDKTFEGILEDLRNYHKYILQLIQDCLRGWGGLEGIVIGQKDRGKDMEDIQKDEGSIPAEKLRFERNQGKEKEFDVSVTSTSLQSSHIVGHSSLYTVLRQNVEAQRKASMKQSQTQQCSSSTQDVEEIRLNHFGLISEKLKADSVFKLNKILHSVIFPPADVELGEPDRLSRRAIKSCFQTFVFQGLQFIDKFGFISKDHLRQFFLEEKTQILIGIHLTDLFGVYWYGFYDFDHFMPDMKFIQSHWMTEHLHTSLQVLDEKQKALVLYTALQETVKAYYDMEEWLNISWGRSHGFFIEQRFLSELDIWGKQKKAEISSPKSSLAVASSSQTASINPSPKSSIVDSTSQPVGIDLMSQSTALDSDCQPDAIESRLRENFGKLIESFQNPTPDPNIENTEINILTRRIDYLLSYHIFNFMKLYYPEILEQFFPRPEEHSTFQIQLELLHIGLEIHQNLNIAIDFLNSEPPEYYEFTITPEIVKRFQQGMMQEELELISGNFMHLWNEALNISNTDSEVKNWLEGPTVSRNIIDIWKSEVQGFKNLGLENFRGANGDYRNVWMVYR